MALDYNTQLDALLARVKSGEAPEITGRELLSWFDAARRGVRVVEWIRRELDKRQLVTDPDFNEVWVDIPLRVRAHQPISPSGEAAAQHPSQEPKGTDPVHRIGRLAAANQPIVSVPLNTALSEAATLMMLHDYSQLPVMRNERDCRGAVTWKSIGIASALGRSTATVDDCLIAAEVVPWDAGLLDTIPKIVANEFVLVRGPDNRFQGIVTVSDLSLQFRSLSEPFLLLGQIENLVRVLVARSFSLDELRQARNPSDAARSVNGVSDLNFGDYVRLLQGPGAWEKLGVAFHRDPFLRELDRTREVRNDVMHFDPDPLDESDVELLRKFAAFLQQALR